jgi:hypothetical protein
MGISETFTIALGLLAGYFFFASLFEKQNADNENTSLSPIFILLLTTCVASGYILFTDSTSKLAGIIFFLALSILAVSFHEFGHAYTALLGGDKSVIRNGYLSLDPLKYSHPLLEDSLYPEALSISMNLHYEPVYGRLSCLQQV